MSVVLCEGNMPLLLYPMLDAFPIRAARTVAGLGSAFRSLSARFALLRPSINFSLHSLDSRRENGI
jgi:hypothetical protein